MIESLGQIDSEILLFFNSMHNAYFDEFFRLATGRFIWIPFYAVLLAILIKKEGIRRTVVWAVGIALSITLADQICATLIRPEVARLRPSNLENPLSAMIHVVNGYRGGPYGFPSCHGANTWALVLFLCPVIRSWRFTIVMVIWATINCYSRMYLGVHYPGDLLAGAVIGGACGYLMQLLAKYVIAKMRLSLPQSNDRTWASADNLSIWGGAIMIGIIATMAAFMATA